MKCSKCGKYADLYTINYSFYTQRPQLCESCLILIEGNYTNEVMNCIYHSKGNSECSSNKHFLRKSQFSHFMDIGICENHVTAGLKYFEEMREQKYMEIEEANKREKERKARLEQERRKATQVQLNLF